MSTFKYKLQLIGTYSNDVASACWGSKMPNFYININKDNPTETASSMRALGSCYNLVSPAYNGLTLDKIFLI